VALVIPVAGVSATDELRVVIPWTPENLDPTMNLSSIPAQVGVSLFDSLVGRDQEGRSVPELAESWKLLNDTTWQLGFRPGALFRTGEPFNAEAVRFTIQRVLDPSQKSPNRANIAEITRVGVADEFTRTSSRQGRTPPSSTASLTSRSYLPSTRPSGVTRAWRSVPWAPGRTASSSWSRTTG
jgi:peptide/nickel transport system substrate-binding protein